MCTLWWCCCCCKERTPKKVGLCIACVSIYMRYWYIITDENTNVVCLSARRRVIDGAFINMCPGEEKKNVDVGFYTHAYGLNGMKRTTGQKKIFENNHKTHLFDGAVRHAQIVVLGASPMVRPGVVGQMLKIRFVLGQSLDLWTRKKRTGLVTVTFGLQARCSCNLYIGNTTLGRSYIIITLFRPWTIYRFDRYKNFCESVYTVHYHAYTSNSLL